MPDINSKYLVSVCMVTYAHAEFISQALDGILIQKTNFPFEIVIGEDCGPDNTREICKEYQKKYPDIIKLNFQKKNIGAQNNFIDTLDKCKGKYIALCEGDDYWNAPDKLQKQVDFLEANPDFTLCANTSNILQFGELIENKAPEKDILTFKDVLAQNWGIMTASILFKREAFQIPSWYKDIVNGDYALQLIVSTHGKIKILPEAMSVYRRHLGGISMKLKPFNQASWLIYLLFEFNNYTNDRFKKDILRKIKTTYKNQTRFAKDNNLRRDYVKLSFFRLISVFFPFAIKNYRK